MNNRWLPRWRNHVALRPTVVFERVVGRGLEERRVEIGLDGKTIMRWGRKVLADCKEMKVECLDWSRGNKGHPWSFTPPIFCTSLPTTWKAFFHWRSHFSSLSNLGNSWSSLSNSSSLKFPLWLRLWFLLPLCPSVPVLLHRMHCVALINF